MTLPDGITKRHTLSTGLTLTADHHGDPTNPPVLFLHGGGQTRHSWGRTARQLAARGWYAVTLDHRGHGESDWDAEARYGLVDYAEDAAAFVASLAAPPVLVGASLGGLTGIHMEGRVAPGSVSALVLVDIVPHMNTAGADRILAFMEERMTSGFASLEEVADAVAAYNPHRPRPADPEGLKKNLRLRDGRWYWHWDPATLTAHGDIRNDSALRRDQHDLTSEALHQVTKPILLIRGRQSDLVTDDEVTAFRQTWPHAQYTDVSDAGHMVSGDNNDAFTEAVVSFLAQLS